MSDKFTYIDFLMYVIPGAFLCIVVLSSFCLLTPGTTDLINADLFSSIVFLVISFVFGNCLQVYSHKGPEERLKKEYWRGLYPSQIMFFPENMIINEQGREDLLKACVKMNLLKEDDIPLFSTSGKYPKPVVNKGQNAFNYMRTYLAEKGKGERIRGAEGYFLFFRGMFVASFWAALTFGFVAVCYVARTVWPVLDSSLGKLPSLLYGFILPLVGTAICLFFWRTFRYRCRGAAQGFAKEVYRAFCAHVFIERQQESQN